MKKILASFFIVMLISITFNGCKTTKHSVLNIKKTDSVRLQKNENIIDKSLMTSGIEKYLEKSFIFNSLSNISIDKIKTTTLEENQNELVFEFDIKKIQAKGDTATCVDSKTGTQIKLYKDEKTGGIKASMRPPNKKTTTVELEGLELKSSNQIQKNTISKEVDTSKNSTEKKLNKNYDSISNKSGYENIIKNKVSEPTFFSQTILYTALAIVLVILFIFLNKKFSLIKRILSIFKKK